MTTFVPDPFRVNIAFINTNAKCNNFGFEYNRNTKVIDVVYDLILNNCKLHIYNNVKQPLSIHNLLYVYHGGKIINEEDTFYDLSPTSKEYTIYVGFKLLGDRKLMEELELKHALGLVDNEYYGLGKKQSRISKTTKKYCSKCKSKKTLRHKHSKKHSNKNKK